LIRNPLKKYMANEGKKCGIPDPLGQKHRPGDIPAIGLQQEPGRKEM
jgi:hypothetical protein